MRKKFRSKIRPKSSSKRSKKTRKNLPQILEARIFDTNSDGDVLAVPDNWNENKQGDPPTILIIQDQNENWGEQTGLGNILKIRLLGRSKDADVDYIGKITASSVKSKKINTDTYLAVVESEGDDFYLAPVDRNQKASRILSRDLNNAEVGDLVLAQKSNRRSELRTSKIHKRICSIQNERALSQIALHKFEIPHEFTKETLKEADSIQQADLTNREDWTDLNFITIDPSDAKDHDDAVFVEPDTDRNNPNGWVVYVAIADVAYYVRPGSRMDIEAQKRGNSIYFPDHVVPMLPEKISNNLCSLKEGEDRPAIVAKLTYDQSGNRKKHKFHRVMIHISANLSYEQTQQAIDGSPDLKSKPILKNVLKPLWSAYKILKEKRDAREPLELDIPERRITLNDDGTIGRVYIPERLESHRLIEEYMIQANIAAAETLETHQTALLYRIHDSPSFEKVNLMQDFLSNIGIQIKKTSDQSSSRFNSILNQNASSKFASLVNEVILRTQSQAEYNPQNIGHFGLNLRKYAHFTSPIRRYADIIIHRGLIRALNLGTDGLPDGFEEQLDSLGSQISSLERRAMVAERETFDRIIANWLSETKEATFFGSISGVIKSGLFVRLDDYGADGFIPIASIGYEYYDFVENHLAIIGTESKSGYQLGDKVEIKIADTNPYAGTLRFELLSEGRKLKITPKLRKPDRSRKRKYNRKGRKR